MSLQYRWLVMMLCFSAALSLATTGLGQTTLSLVGTNVVLSFPAVSNQVYPNNQNSYATVSSAVASNVAAANVTITPPTN